MDIVITASILIPFLCNATFPWTSRELYFLRVLLLRKVKAASISLKALKPSLLDEMLLIHLKYNINSYISMLIKCSSQNQEDTAHYSYIVDRFTQNILAASH